MASSSSSRSLKYSTDYSTRSQGAVERMNDIYTGFINNNNISDFTIIHELSLLFPLLILIQFLPRSHVFLPV